MKMLINPIEEQFNLPPFAVQYSDGKRVFKRKVVSQEAIGLSGLKVIINNESHRVGILSGGVVAGKPDCLIGKNTGTVVYRPGFQNLVDHIVFGPGDKEGAFLLEVLVKLLISDISFVHQRMHLERALTMMGLCPRTQLQTELNCATVERIYHLFKTNPQLFILVKRGGFLHQSQRKVLIDTPILLLVGLCKRGSGHHLDTRPVEGSA